MIHKSHSKTDLIDLINDLLLDIHFSHQDNKKNLQDKFIEFMKEERYLKPYGCLAMTDEFALVKFMMDEKKTWTQIDMRYNCVPWKNDITNSYILHYFNKEKPWIQNSRKKWHDLQLWWDVFDELCNECNNVQLMNL